MDHDQLKARIAQRFIDAGWCPALTEVDVGDIGGVVPSNLANHVKAGWDEGIVCARYGARRWIADVAGTVPVVPSRFDRMGLATRWEEARAKSGGRPLTWLVEVKVARGDFLGDRKFEAPARAHIQFLAYPMGLVKLEEVPDGWVGLEVCGKVIRKRTHHAKVNPIGNDQEARFHAKLAHLLWHREWRGVEADLEAQARKDRRAVERDGRKVSDIVQGVIDYMDPRPRRWGSRPATLLDSLRGHRVNRAPAQYVVEEAMRIRDAIDHLAGDE